MEQIAEEWSRLASVVAHVESSLDKWLDENHHVKLTEFRALALLGQAAEKELRVTELAEQVNLTPSSATRLISRLESKGLAQRQLCDVDGRGIYAVISSAGELLLERASLPYTQELDRHLQLRTPGGVTSKDREHPLATALAALLN